MSDLALFAVSIATGLAEFGLYLLLSLLRKSGGIVGTVIADAVFAAAFFAPLFFLGFFFRDGTIKLFTVVGQALGFVACYFATKKISTAVKAKRGQKS